MRLGISVPAVLVAMLAVDRAEAQAAPDGAQAMGGERTHDGFYLRLSLGGGALHAEFEKGDQTPSADGSSGAVLVDILVGGTPAPGLVVGGGYQVDIAQGADVDYGSQSISGATIARGVVGPFIEWFPDPKGGFSAGLLAGSAIVAIQSPTLEFLGTKFGADISSLGIGGNLWAGYALWISSQWSLGLEARAGLASTKNSDDSSQSGSATSFGLLLTAVYH